MLASYRQQEQVKPLFSNLPQELYREIYDYDPTYHSVFSSQAFAEELERRILRVHRELLTCLIERRMQVSNRYEEIVCNYEIRLYPYRQRPDVMRFVLKPINITFNARNLPEPLFTWSGYIFNQNIAEIEYMPFIDFNRIDHLIIPSISKSLIMYYEVDEPW